LEYTCASVSETGAVCVDVKDGEEAARAGQEGEQGGEAAEEEE
jgi:hypothetical protein